jgi:hypothetical protein
LAGAISLTPIDEQLASPVASSAKASDPAHRMATGSGDDTRALFAPTPSVRIA